MKRRTAGWSVDFLMQFLTGKVNYCALDLHPAEGPLCSPISIGISVLSWILAKSIAIDGRGIVQEASTHSQVMFFATSTPVLLVAILLR